MLLQVLPDLLPDLLLPDLQDLQVLQVRRDLLEHQDLTDVQVFQDRLGALVSLVCLGDLDLQVGIIFTTIIFCSDNVYF